MNEEFATRSELSSLKIDLDEISKTLQKVDNRDYEDSMAFTGIILKHDRRIKKIENKLGL